MMEKMYAELASQFIHEHVHKCMSHLLFVSPIISVFSESEHCLMGAHHLVSQLSQVWTVDVVTGASPSSQQSLNHDTLPGMHVSLSVGIPGPQ